MGIFSTCLDSDYIDYTAELEKEDKKRLIKKWIKEHTSFNGRTIAYSFTDDLKINVKSGCTIKKKKGENSIEEFPSYIKFNICKGPFTCSYLGLTTLEGCPKTVYGSFDCSHNNLETLEGGPITLEKKFTKNVIKSFKRFTKNSKQQYDAISYNCSYNDIMLFEGKPKNTKNCELICNNNPFLNIMMKHLAGKFDRGYKIL